MDDVKVHYGSAQPAKLNAYAYAQGAHIHLAPGQEKHLPHEAWHVVQQKQRRVKPTLQMKSGTYVNDDMALEKEADIMGNMASHVKADPSVVPIQNREKQNFASFFSESPPLNFIQLVGMGLNPGTTVMVTSGAKNRNDVGVIVKAASGGYKVKFGTDTKTHFFDYSQLSLSVGPVPGIRESSGSVAKTPAPETISGSRGIAKKAQPAKGSLLPTTVSTSSPLLPDVSPLSESKAEDDDLALAPRFMPSSIGISESASSVASPYEMTEREVQDAPMNEPSSMAAASSSPQERADTHDDLSELIRHLILKDGWNDHALVEQVGSHEWSEIKKIWDELEKSKDEELQNKIRKLMLLKLRGEPYKEKGDAVTNYAEWPSSINGKQDGHRWGTETEGGHIEVKLNQAYQESAAGGPASASSTTALQSTARVKLIQQLVYFKRTELLVNQRYRLALDNVMSHVDSLLMGKRVLLPIEIASTPMKGQVTGHEPKVELRKSEGRNRDIWPRLGVKKNKLILVGKGDKPGDALKLFNDIFTAYSASNISSGLNPQHVTVSGNSESRLEMARELESTTHQLNPGTRGKSDLSGKPKTSMEFLRDPVATEDASHLEKIAHGIRTTLREKLTGNVKFADEHLKCIILPRGGAPREIGGYTLTTPMTNAFPLIGKSKTKDEVTVLREHR